MYNNYQNQEAKVTVGCRVDNNLKQKLIKEAQELDYRSLSHYLEEMITNRDQLSVNNDMEEVLTKSDLDNIELRLAPHFKELSQKPIEESEVLTTEQWLTWYLTTLKIDGEYQESLKEDLLEMNLSEEDILSSMDIRYR